MTVRIGLLAGGEAPQRAFHSLTAQPEVTAELLEGGGEPGGEWDAVVVPVLSPATRPWWDWSLAEGVPTVLAAPRPADYPLPPQAVAVAGVLEGENLAAALLEATDDERGPIRLAWTTPGPPLGNGEAVNFPFPAGPLWAGRAQGSVLPERAVYLEAPVDGPWMALSAERGSRITAAADRAAFLRGIFLAAAALTAARGHFPPGWNRPADPSGMFLSAARQMGLELATFTPAP